VKSWVKSVKFSEWLGFIVFVISLYVLWEIRQLILLVFTSVVFTVALNRMVSFLRQRFRLQRHIAILLTLFLTCFIVFLLLDLVIPPFLEQFQKLLGLLPNVWEQIRLGLSVLKEKSLQLDWLPSLPDQEDLSRQIQPITTLLFANFFALFSNSMMTILGVLLVILFSLMMLANPQSYRRALLYLFPSFYRRRADEILTLTEASLGSWLVGVAISSAFVGALSGVGLLFLQVKLVLVHAIIAGILNFIPNIGPASSVIFPIMVALLDSPWKIGLIILLYVIIQNIESYVLTPTVMAKQVSLLPAVTLIAQIFFAQSFGLLGLLLALPLTVVAKVWLEEVFFKDVMDRWQSTHEKK
jgi:predicted PurR-regulated permease PerM